MRRRTKALLWAGGIAICGYGVLILGGGVHRAPLAPVVTLGGPTGPLADRVPVYLDRGYVIMDPKARRYLGEDLLRRLNERGPHGWT